MTSCMIFKRSVCPTVCLTNAHFTGAWDHLEPKSPGGVEGALWPDPGTSCPTEPGPSPGQDPQALGSAPTEESQKPRGAHVPEEDSIAVGQGQVSGAFLILRGKNHLKRMTGPRKPLALASFVPPPPPRP